MVVPVDAKFPTCSLHLTCVFPHLSVPHWVTEDEEVVFPHQHIVRCLLEVIRCNLQAALEKSEVKTHVPVLHGFPLQVSVSDTAHSRTDDAVWSFTEYIGCCTDRAEVCRVVDVLVTNLTPTSTDLDVIKHLLVLHELLAGKAISSRYRWEGSPFVVLGELGRTIHTDRCCEVVLLCVVVHHTSQVRYQRSESVGTRSCWVLGS